MVLVKFLEAQDNFLQLKVFQIAVQQLVEQDYILVVQLVVLIIFEDLNLLDLLDL